MFIIKIISSNTIYSMPDNRSHNTHYALTPNTTINEYITVDCYRIANAKAHLQFVFQHIGNHCANVINPFLIFL